MSRIVFSLRDVARRCRSFIRDDSGATAMFMALTSMPLIFAIGAGVDYSSANMAKTKLDAVADSAALVGRRSPAHHRHHRCGAEHLAKRLHRRGGQHPQRHGEHRQHHRHRHRHRPHRGRQLLGDEDQHVHGVARNSDHDDHRAIDRCGGALHQHQFLSAARQFAVDEHRGDDGRHQHHGRQHPGARRLRVRLPRIQSVGGQSGQSGRRRQLHAGAAARRGDADTEHGDRDPDADDDRAADGAAEQRAISDRDLHLQL